MLELIEKYENQNKINYLKLKELQKINDITNQNTRDILKE